MSSTLIELAGRDGGIKCLDYPDLSPILVLDHWSKKIREDFERRSAEARLSVTDESGHEYHSMISTLSAEVRGLSNNVAGMKRKLDDVVEENANKTATIATLQEQNVKLRRELDAMHRKEQQRLHFMMSTPDGGVSKRPRTETDSSATRINFTANDAGVATAAAPLPEAAAAAETTPPPSVAAETAAPSPAPAVASTAPPPATGMKRGYPPPVKGTVTLRYGYQAHQPTKKGTMKHLSFSLVLYTMAKKGYFRVYSKFKKASIPSELNVSEPSLVTYCLELADFIDATTGDDQFKSNMTFLRACSSSSKELDMKNAANYVETKCLRVLDRLMPPESQKPSEPFSAAMGRRIRDYKNRIKKAKNLQDQPLHINMIPLEDLERLDHERVQDVD